MNINFTIYQEGEYFVPDCDILKGYIYEIIDKQDNIIYIGQSRNIFSRLSSHLNKYKEKIKKIKFYMVDRKDLLIIEEYFIKTKKPKYNKPVYKHNFNKKIYTDLSF